MYTRLKKSIALLLTLAMCLSLFPAGAMAADAQWTKVEFADIKPEVTIAAARAEAKGNSVTVEGIVTFTDGRNVVIQDVTAGIFIDFGAAGAAKVGDTDVALGDVLNVTGKLGAYNEQLQLTAPAAEHKSSGAALPAAQEKSIDELLTIPESGSNPLEGSRVTLKSAVLGAVNTSGETLVSVGGKEIALYKMPAPGAGIYQGCTIDVTAVLGRFTDTSNNKSQLRVAQASDITLVSAPAKVSAPVPSIASGTQVVTGTKVTFTSATTDAVLQYSITSATEGFSAVPEGGVAIAGAVGAEIKLWVKATKTDMEGSDVVALIYTIKEAPLPTADPIPDSSEIFTSTVKNVKEVAEAVAGGSKSAFTVVGQLVYRFGNYDGVDTAILQDVIDGQTYALQVYSALSGMNVGDIVKVTGNGQVYGSVPQLSSIVTVEKVASITAPPMAPDAYASFADMAVDKGNKVSRFVKISNVTLGTYSGSASTTVTDSTGVTYPIYHAATYPQGVTANDVVDLYAVLSRYSATWQLRTGTSGTNGFPAYLVTDDTKAPAITVPTPWINPEVGKDYQVSVDIVDNVGVVSATITYTVGDGSAKTGEMVKDATTGKYQFTIPAGELTAGNKQITLTITAADAKNNSATTPTQTIAFDDLPQVVSVTPARGSATGSEKRPEIALTFANAGEGATIKLTLTSEKGNAVFNAADMKVAENKAALIPAADLEDGLYTAKVVITRADAKSVTYTWTFTVGEPVVRMYFGQLHSHTTYSDGSGTLEDALSYIENTAKNNNVQFVAFTDHSNYFDTSGAANPADALYDMGKASEDSRNTWGAYKNAIAKFNQNSTGILALGGFEMTWSGGPGHMNTFNTAGIVSRNNSDLNNKSNADKDQGMQNYYALLSQEKGAQSISQFNHPGTTFGTFTDFAYWNPVIDTRVALLEVGNGEGAVGAGGYYPSFGEYTRALDKGWHVAPTNNQDNHKGKWGDANDARTVIITDDFTEEGLYQAMRDRHVYATEDKNLQINYTVNDQMMGSTIAEEPAALNIRAVITDPDSGTSGDKISKVELIVNGGRTAYSWDNISDHRATVEATLPADYSYYYLRVTQADKNIAVTAPVWVGKATVVGIDSLTSNVAVPVTGEALTLTTKIFNSESTPATIKTITYALEGGKVLSTQKLNKVLSAGATYNHTFSYTPTLPIDQTIVVTVVIAADGKETDYVAQLTLAVMDDASLVYVGIDASHYNEYVDGNYKDSMSNFTKLATEYNVRVVELETSQALIAATQNPKYKLFLFTAPSRRNGSVLLDGYKNYTQSEVDAVAVFAKNGGTVIVTGWSDYYESYKAFPAEDHMAAQQNRLLEAIGSSLRLADDGTLDDTNNGGQNPRLYLTDYNGFKSPLLSGVIYDPLNEKDNTKSQLFSHYGGSSVYAVNGNKAPSATLPSSVTPIISGHSTTYSKEQDSDNLGGLVGGAVPRYPTTKNPSGSILVTASEEITHEGAGTSQVIVSGGAFMSNFEIQATLDNVNEYTYSNYNMLENLMASINQPVITHIADLATAKEGYRFTVEGLVTSNASDYDKDTAFFDCIYLQDETGGINVFPVSGSYKIGQKLRISGSISAYQGERQLAVKQVKLLDETPAKVTPSLVATRDIAQNTKLGQLVTIAGVVVSYSKAEGATQTIMVRDNSGYDARVFIDGYITTGKDTDLYASLKVGNKITVTGLASYDNTFDGPAPRIRIRDRGDIICINETADLPAGVSSAVITIPPANFAGGMAGAEDDAFMREGVALANPSSTDTVAVTGTLAYKQGFTGFWPGNAAMQKGNFLGVRLTLPNYAGLTPVITFGDKTITAPDGHTSANGNPYYDLIKRIDTASPNFTITVDLDGEGTGYAPTTYTFDLAGLILGVYVPPPSSGSSSTDPVVRPEDVKVGDTSVEIKLPSAVAKLNAVANEKVIAVNANKPIMISGGGLNIIIPAGTLAAGADVNALLVNPKAAGNVIRVTRADGTTAILPISTVSGGQAAYVANIPGRYEVVDNTKTFPDIANHWAEDAIGFVAARELFKGDSHGSFGPDQPMTRGMLVTVLSRIAGGKAISGTPFADVAGSDWYAKEVAWAAQNKLVEGDGVNFNPDGLLTREQLCVILIRYLNHSGLTLAETKPVGTYADMGAVSPWAKAAMEQAIKTGLIDGKSGGLLDPQGQATRAEIATILQRFVEGVLK